jgi:hypothetical protein
VELKPTVNESFRNYCFKRMSVQKDFIELFYEVLYQSALEGRDLTHRQAFKVLNELYFNVTGRLRYSDYITFCINRIRMDNIELRNNPKAR